MPVRRVGLLRVVYAVHARQERRVLAPDREDERVDDAEVDRAGALRASAREESGRRRAGEEGKRTDLDRRPQDLVDALGVVGEGALEREPEVVQRARDVGVLVLRRCRERAEERHGGVVVRDLREHHQHRDGVECECEREGRTRPSDRLTNLSTARLAPLATALTRRGSKRAASSSLTIERAVVRPSLAVGTVGGRAEKDGVRDDEIEKADVTASLSRLVERVR